MTAKVDRQWHLVGVGKEKLKAGAWFVTVQALIAVKGPKGPLMARSTEVMIYLAAIGPEVTTSSTNLDWPSCTASTSWQFEEMLWNPYVERGTIEPKEEPEVEESPRRIITSEPPRSEGTRKLSSPSGSRRVHLEDIRLQNPPKGWSIPLRRPNAGINHLHWAEKIVAIIAETTNTDQEPAQPPSLTEPWSTMTAMVTYWGYCLPATQSRQPGLPKEWTPVVGCFCGRRHYEPFPLTMAQEALLDAVLKQPSREDNPDPHKARPANHDLAICRMAIAGL